MNSPEAVIRGEKPHGDPATADDGTLSLRDNSCRQCGDERRWEMSLYGFPVWKR